MKVSQWARQVVTVILLLLMVGLQAAAQATDRERLGMGLEYFRSGKYHEALLILQKLDRQYRLNPRIRAYIGVCFYYEWDYKMATTYLDSVIPKLTAFSPQERSFYFYANGESHFNLKQYDKALLMYQQMLEVCHDNEKADAFYRIGFIHVYNQDWLDALDNLQSALVYYRQYQPKEKARVAQIRNMINGCCARIRQEEKE